MCIKLFYKLLLVITGVLLVGDVFSQANPQIAFSDYEDLVDYNHQAGDGNVCPSLDRIPYGTIDVSSTNEFHLDAYHADMGDEDLNTFEWIVYGGWITEISGLPIVTGDYSYCRLRTSSGNIRYSYIEVVGVSNPTDQPEDWESFITVEWDTTNASPVNAWVAVKQSSEWGCSEPEWRVYTNVIVNDPPEFDDPDFPEDIRLPYQLRTAYELPLPDVNDDACHPSYLSRTVSVNRPSSGLWAGDEGAGNHTLDLDVGDNLVTWYVTDGYHTVSRSYTITIEPAFEILNIAWTHPTRTYATCIDNNDGALLITDVTDYSFNGSIEYSFDGGANWGAALTANGLDAGSYTVQGRINYLVDSDNDGDVDDSYTEPTQENYTVTLTYPASSASGALPDASITETSCQSYTDGVIDLTAATFTSANNSVAFDGDDYLLLNKNYNNQTLTQFSIATWVKVGNASGTLISFGAPYFELSVVYYSSGSQSLIRFKTNTEEGNFRSNSLSPVNDGDWHLVVATYDNGNRAIFIDGEKQELASSGPLSVGGSEIRYGMIGASSAATEFTDNPQAPFFSGQMAEMALWESAVLSDEDVVDMMKTGIVTYGPDEHWVLNDVPSEVSATHDHVFTDLGNHIVASNWGRFFNCSRANNDAPILLSWTDSEDAPVDGSYLLENLAVGDYTLHARDIFGCGEVTRAYTVGNSDNTSPSLFWNAAIRKTATQLSTNGSAFASLAVDGYASGVSETNNEDEVWWDVDLGGIYPIRFVHIHPETDFGNFYVMVSQSAFSAVSDLTTDLARADVTRIQYTGTTNGSTAIRFPTGPNARYVRIRTVGAATLHFAEVEVLTSQTPVPPRVLYLTSSMDNEDCEYEITADDYSIAPYAWDACDVISSFTNDLKINEDNLEGIKMGLGDHTVRWTATDDGGNPDTELDIIYRITDNTPPLLDAPDFRGAYDEITYCTSIAYSLDLPVIDDNYPLITCGDLTSIELYSEVNGVYYRAYNRENIDTYDPDVPESTGNLVYEDYLPAAAGYHALVWRVRDYSGNLNTDTLHLHVQRKPEVVDVKASPITCNGADNAVVTFVDIRSELDINPGLDIIYFLEETTTSDTYEQPFDPVIYPVAPGTYNAYIVVDECWSEAYSLDIVITEPAAIEPTADITPETCSGSGNGSVELTIAGGSNTNVLHFLGGDNAAATAPNYAGLSTVGADAGTIEGWVYLDTLSFDSPGSDNNDAGIFGLIDGTTTGFQFQLVNGQLQFIAWNGGAPAFSVETAIPEREWVHISGTWNVSTGMMYLAVNGSNVGSNYTGISDPSSPGVYFGCYPGGGDANILRGFVRSVRVWDRALEEGELSANFYLLDPIDPDGNLIANYPIAGGGTNLQNRVPGGTGGTVNTANYEWQKFAYYWVDEGDNFVARTQNIYNQGNGEYTVIIQDPLGCDPVIETYEIDIADDSPPTMAFSNNGYNVAPFLTVGEPIRRYTSSTAGVPENVSGDCLYYPFDQEFDPYVDDGVCLAGDVTLTIEALYGSFDPTNPPAIDAQSLDGVSMTDSLRVRWTATDQAGNSSTKIVRYLIIDDEKPEMTWEDQSRSNTAGECGYTVLQDDSLLSMTFDDNCETGTLFNNINGTNSLEGEFFDVGDHSITWTYRDKTLYAAEFTGLDSIMTQTLTVVDNEVPNAYCIPGPVTVYLDANGKYPADPLEFDSFSDDNCGIVDYQLSIGGAPIDTFRCTDLGNNTVRNTVTDAEGNSSYCELTVTVADNIDPVAVTQFFTLEVGSGSGGTVTLTPADVDGGSYDNCGIVDMRVNPEEFSCADIAAGLLEVTLTVEDASGNTDEEYAYITVSDETDPVPDCYADASQGEAIDTLYLNNRGQHVILESEIDEGSTDNCAISYFVIDPVYDTLTCAHLGAVRTVQLTVYDVSGNSASCNASIRVLDTIPPEVVAPFRIVPIDNGDGNANITAESYRNLGTRDNCTDVADLTFMISIEETPGSGDWETEIDITCVDLNTLDPNETEVDVPIWVQVTDTCGNVSEVLSTVRIVKTLTIDAIGMTDCPGIESNIYAVVGGGGTILNYTWYGNGDSVFIVCSKQVFQCMRGIGGAVWRAWGTRINESEIYFNDTLSPGTYTITYTAEDIHNCFVSKDYTFYWDGTTGNTNAISEDTVCAYELKTYEASNIIPPSPGNSPKGDEGWLWNNSEIYAETIWDGSPTANDTLNESITIQWHNEGYDDQIQLEYSYDIEIGAGIKYRCYNYFDINVNVRPPLDLSFEEYGREICPLSIQEYDLVDQDMTGLPPDDEFNIFTWDLSGLPVDASLYDAGTEADDSILILWGDPSTSGTVGVTVENRRGCEGTETTDVVSVEDITDPVIPPGKCAADVVHNNFPLDCDYTFGAIELPVLTVDSITDDCLDENTAPYYSFTATRSDAVDYTDRTYPVGQTTVMWIVIDLGDNKDTCYQTITVLDTEAPIITSSLANVTLYAGANCNKQYDATDPDRDVVAEDNCAGASDLVYTLSVDYGNDLSVEETIPSNTPEDLTDPFPLGISKIEISVADTAVDETGSPDPNIRTASFLVTVVDTVRPVIVPLPVIASDNGVDSCEVNLSSVIQYPGHDGDIEDQISDNCSDDADLVVAFVSRSDGRALSYPYPVGSTTITWRVTDESLNSRTAQQTVTVTDAQEPEFDPADLALQDTSIGYCFSDAHRLRIPVPSDNCEVLKIYWSVVNDGGTAYSDNDSIARADWPTFNPYGDGYTRAIDALPADDETGSDYTVTWTLLDIHGNRNTVETYTYTLHTEINPNLDQLSATQMSCGGADDGQITVVTNADDYRVEPGQTVYYTIDNWDNEQHFIAGVMETPETFTGLAAATYDVQMMVNGCYSNTLQATITQPELYTISLAPTDPYCYEGTDGAIDLTMTGGVEGQVHFASGGSGLTASHYSELDLTSTGSIEAWVYLESLDDVTLVSKGTDYSLRLDGGKFTIDVDGTYLGDNPGEGAGMTPELFHWYYVVGTWSVGVGMNIYVDEAPQGGSIQNGPLANAPTSASDVTIGASMAGILREVRIWSNVADGSIPGTRYSGNETNLEAYWPLDDGSTDNAINYCKVKISASDATGATGLWANDEPQPGTYTWTLDGAYYSDSIDLVDLARGEYEVTFQDPFGCPVEGLSESETLVPTDNEQPNIPNFDNDTLYVDPGDDCQRVITEAEADGLRPEITDICEFDTTWRITPELTLIPQVFNASNFAGAVLELGRNLVAVTATQYDGTVTATSFYYIVVEDDIDPEAVPTSISDVNLSNDYTPMGSGIVYYDAFGFDDGSSDNCTPTPQLEYKISIDGGQTWEDELLFTCNEIGTAAQVSFKVTDLFGNADSVIGEVGMTVQDIHAPVFLGTTRYVEACATVDEQGAVPAYTTLPVGSLRLDETDYTDNCSVNQIHYQLDHETYVGGDTGWIDGDDAGGEIFYLGTTYVWFRIVDSDLDPEDGGTPVSDYSTQIMYEVTILPKPAPGSTIY